MTNTLRSKQGCWTCRLRKKKCDEKHPLCATCESLTITCYGYGPKPDWMDNGEKEKAIAKSIKEIVKHTSRRKGRLGLSIGRFRDHGDVKKPESRMLNLAPKSTDADGGRQSSVTAHSNHGPESVSQESDSPEHSNGSTSVSKSSPNTEPDINQALEASWLSPEITNSETELLMHFLDVVFPLQYPMYRSGITEGGRGWLLSLLFHTKPLYHAALALSSYHRGSVLLAENYVGCHALAATEKESHLAICLADFRQSIKKVGRWVEESCPENVIGIMACVIQLIFFELFAGHGDAWKIHLRAATDIYLQCYKNQSIPLFQILESSRNILEQGFIPPEQIRSFIEMLPIFKFLSGAVLWLDTISSITLEISPRLLSIHPRAFSPESQVKMENIMGCKSWVMLQIGRISALYQSKKEMLPREYSGSMSVEFGQSADRIKRDIQQGITEEKVAAISISDPWSTVDCNPTNLSFTTPHLSCTTTHLFALAALIYLEGVSTCANCCGPNEEPAILSEAMMILRTQMPADMMHAIVCPLFIFGTAAKGEDQQFFRHVFLTTPVLEPSLVHRRQILPILEEIWRERSAGTGTTFWTWQDNLRVSNGNLILL